MIISPLLAVPVVASPNIPEEILESLLLLLSYIIIFDLVFVESNLPCQQTKPCIQICKSLRFSDTLSSFDSPSISLSTRFSHPPSPIPRWLCTSKTE